MKREFLTLSVLLFLLGCGDAPPARVQVPTPPPTPALTPAPTVQPPVAPAPVAAQDSPLRAARRAFKTTLVPKEEKKEKASVPPPAIFSLVKYDAAPGALSAYLTPDPKDGKKHPAIIWITGGDCNSIDEVWHPAPPKNDQTAAAYRKAGIIMMFPSLRGGNDNPGTKESFLGEVDDVLDAAEFLSKQPYVDPARIYLGGHSTGGTLALLVAEVSTRFRVVFSFGPVSNVGHYGADYLPFNYRDAQELLLRAPGKWLSSIKSPVYVIEGTLPPANADDLIKMRKDSTNPQIHFLSLPGATHFNTLAPMNKLIAEKILKDDGPTVDLAITSSELPKTFDK